MAPSDYLRFLAALVFVLGLIALLAWLARRTRLGGRPGGGGRRLTLVEVLPLDPRHRLALVRRDGIEHLLLLGQSADRVVETGIPAPAPEAPADPRPTGPRPADPRPADGGPADGGPADRSTRRAGWAMTRWPLALGLMLAALLVAGDAGAQSLQVELGEGGTLSGQLIRLVLLITILSLAPSILVMVTSFTRIVVVLAFLRSALGLQQTPPNSVLISLALFVTAFVMAPTLEQAYQDGLRPLIEEQIEEVEAFDRAAAPLRRFMLAQVRPKDLELFLDISGAEALESPEATPLRMLIPAFMISELRRAFEIGFLIFIPFLIIDMVVASILMSMGMMMLPPVLISLPFKLIFFVLVDGWYLVVGSLIESFATGAP